MRILPSMLATMRKRINKCKRIRCKHAHDRTRVKENIWKFWEKKHFSPFFQKYFEKAITFIQWSELELQALDFNETLHVHSLYLTICMKKILENLTPKVSSESDTSKHLIRRTDDLIKIGITSDLKADPKVRYPAPIQIPRNPIRRSNPARSDNTNLIQKSNSYRNVRSEESVPRDPCSNILHPIETKARSNIKMKFIY